MDRPDGIAVALAIIVGALPAVWLFLLACGLVLTRHFYEQFHRAWSTTTQIKASVNTSSQHSRYLSRGPPG